MVTQPHLLIVISEDWFFWSHRRALARAATEAGYRVTVATPLKAHAGRIQSLGVDVVPLRQLRRSSRNPLREAWTLGELIALYGTIRPDIAHHVTIKPVLYGSVAARIAGLRGIVNGIYGLGHVFSDRGIPAAARRGVVTAAYRASFAIARPRMHATFENATDQDTFISSGIVRRDESTVVRGMGFDPVAFWPTPAPSGPPIILMAGRILWSKGVGELVEASRILRARGLLFRTVLVGTPDTQNPSSVPEAAIRAWVEEGVVEWWGRREDMPEVMAQASIVALPSKYGEGLPKVLIEAAGAGRAIVASDISGCREIARPGENGMLVPPGDATTLADALGLLIGAPDLRARYGARGREIAVAEFSDAVVNAATLSIYETLLGRTVA